MIEFKVVASPDEDVLNTFKFFQNQVYLGKTSGNLMIKDSELERTHLMIEVVENELIVHPQKNVSHYLINGKRAATVRKLKAQDVLTLGKTQIKILAFEVTNLTSKKDILSTKLAQIAESNSALMPVIEQLSKLSK